MTALDLTSDLSIEYRQKIVPALMKKRGYKNVNAVPKVEKVVINCCVGSSDELKTALEDAVNDLSLVTGQKPVKTKAKKSISNFKLRAKQEIGCKVTLRGRMMYDFLLRFMRLALPRIRDFRGVPTRAFDGRGGYTLGIKDHTIFPEIELDKVKRALGMDVSIITTAKSKEETRDLLEMLGMPFAGRAIAAKAD